MTIGETKYWIATHCGENAEDSIKKLFELKNWQFGRSYPDLNTGDIIIFYVSVKGKKKRYFIGEARISSETHEPTRKSIDGGTTDEYEIDFDNVVLWNPLYFTKDMNDDLNFIKEAVNPGMAFKDKAFIKIDEHDYNLIMLKKIVK